MANKQERGTTDRTEVAGDQAPEVHCADLTTMLLRRTAMAFLVVAFAGCASQITRPPEATVAREPVRALTSFEVEISPTAKAAMAEAETQKFDLSVFRGVIQRTLDAAKLVAPDGDFKLTVTIDQLRVRSTFNAIMWGFMAGTDQLNGTAALTRLDGSPVGNFKVGTSYGLGGFGGGQDSSRLAWLYEEFAKMLTQELVALRDRKTNP